MSSLAVPITLRNPTDARFVLQTAPIWVYCKQMNPKSHCNAGMVFAINAPSSGNTFDAFLQNAKSATSTGSSSGSNGATGVHATGALVAAGALLAGALLQL